MESPAEVKTHLGLATVLDSRKAILGPLRLPWKKHRQSLFSTSGFLERESYREMGLWGLMNRSLLVPFQMGLFSLV